MVIAICCWGESCKDGHLINFVRVTSRHFTFVINCENWFADYQNNCSGPIYTLFLLKLKLWHYRAESVARNLIKINYCLPNLCPIGLVVSVVQFQQDRFLLLDLLPANCLITMLMKFVLTE